MFTKFIVGSHIWLVPSELVTDLFIKAVLLLNETQQAHEVLWTEGHKEAFELINNHPAVWKPL